MRKINLPFVGYYMERVDRVCESLSLSREDIIVFLIADAYMGFVGLRYSEVKKKLDDEIVKLRKIRVDYLKGELNLVLPEYFGNILDTLALKYELNLHELIYCMIGIGLQISKEGKSEREYEICNSDSSDILEKLGIGSKDFMALYAMYRVCELL